MVRPTAYTVKCASVPPTATYRSPGANVFSSPVMASSLVLFGSTASYFQPFVPERTICTRLATTSGDWEISHVVPRHTPCQTTLYRNAPRRPGSDQDRPPTDILHDCTGRYIRVMISSASPGREIAVCYGIPTHFFRAPIASGSAPVTDLPP